jgi:hypothetical protein
VRPEDAFGGKIIIIDLPVQDYRLAGKVANLAWKYCFQVAVLRRSPPTQPGTYLRPVFLWADEAQNFVTNFDAEYQAVARSAGGCTVYLTQNRESYRRVLGNSDAVDWGNQRVGGQAFGRTLDTCHQHQCRQFLHGQRRPRQFRRQPQ